MPVFPDPNRTYPVTLPDGSELRTMVFLNRVIDHPNIEIGDFSYYSDFGEVSDHASHLAPYLFPGSAERLIIGRFCQFAHGTRFITASANHPMSGFSTFPFAVFDPETMADYDHLALLKGDTRIGNDVWICYEGTVMPGVTIGDGAIVAAKSVVTRDVPPFAIVAGNPAKPVRMRFAPEIVARLMEIRWWDWPTNAIARYRHAIEGADISKLEAAAREVAAARQNG